MVKKLERNQKAASCPIDIIGEVVKPVENDIWRSQWK